MFYILHAYPHPLGIVVANDDGARKLLIEGESCCGIPFDELRKFAAKGGKVKVDEARAQDCRLLVARDL
ncbi:MAG TPA: hypothetical protein VN448_04970 [Gammaproteobacteria bacterium]|jgi:hypothetical protein|nr:hypothetical protein [Gammaproteobacteria bacterium]